MSHFVPRTMEDLALEFPPEIQHISASSIKMAIRCEEQWRQVYLQKHYAPPSLALLAGRADHAAIELSMTQKIETHEDLPVRVVEEAFVNEIESQVELSGGLNEIDAKVDEYDETRKTGSLLVGMYQRNISPTIQPTMVEHEFRLPIDGLPVELLGYIDLADDNRIIDRKRSKRAKYKPDPDWILQANVYQLAVPKQHDWHVSVATSKPQIITSLSIDMGVQEATRRLLRDVTAKIGFLYQRYGPDEPWPATGKAHPFACGYCGFRPTCHGWSSD